MHGREMPRRNGLTGKIELLVQWTGKTTALPGRTRSGITVGTFSPWVAIPRRDIVISTQS